MQVKAKKSLGQNFLHDANVIEKIFEVAEVRPDDRILEIGPGTGGLTVPLSEMVDRVVAIELDHELAVRLKKQFSGSEKISIIEGNILEVDVVKILEASDFLNHRYKVIANIPYYITAPIIRALLSLPSQPTSLTLMVQDEVADRLAAEPGKMSLLSVMAQYYAKVEKKFFVPKDSFDPVPKVDSAVVSLIPVRQFSPAHDKAVFRLARAGFAARRKTLANNLASTFSLPKENVEQKIESLGLRKDIRAQALSIENWEKLSLIWE